MTWICDRCGADGAYMERSDGTYIHGVEAGCIIALKAALGEARKELDTIKDMESYYIAELEHAKEELPRLRADVEKLKEDVECYEAMKRGVAVRIGDLEDRNEKLRKVREALQDLKINGCWCQKGIGNPMYKEHTTKCIHANDALAATEPENK